MSTDYRARTLLGVPIPRDIKIFIVGTRKVKAFDHGHPETWVFEPTTGQRLWKEEPIYHPEYSNDEREGKELFGGFEIFRAPHAGPSWLVHAKIDCCSSRSIPGFMSIPSEGELQEIKDRFKKLLEPLNAWDEARFGIHTVLYTW